jgi:hypothetical protein
MDTSSSIEAPSYTSAGTSRSSDSLGRKARAAKWWLLTALLTLCPLGRAATLHCGPASTGSGSGADWNNQCNFKSGGLSRGNTYYLADGTYGSRTFGDAHSGSQLIIVKKATAADHGTNTGWQSAFGDGQAAFTDMTFTRGYYTIDGASGGGPNNWESGFGITVRGVDGPQFVDNNADFITLAHIDLNGGASGPSDDRGMVLYAMNNFTIRYSYIHDVGCDMISMNVMNNFTIEYSKLARNHQTASGCHGDLIEYQIGNASNFVIRYNFFEDIVGSYAFGSHEPTINGYEIYGNIFYWPSQTFFGNGLVGTLSAGGTISNLKFHNNTILGNCGGLCGFGVLRGSGNSAYNNIWVQTAGDFSVGFSNAAHSNNTCYNTSCSGEQNLSGNPFVNSSARDFRLKSALAGTSIGSPYNVDMTGSTRGGDGTWDRGSLEFGGTGNPPPTPPVAPTNLSATPTE